MSVRESFLVNMDAVFLACDVRVGTGRVVLVSCCECFGFIVDFVRASELLPPRLCTVDVFLRSGPEYQ